MPTTSPSLDVLVIGAGPAGIGAGLALDAVDGLTYGILERGAVGQTFLNWPTAQTFLTPSFTGNGFGATDLNAVHPRTSPAFSLAVDYPTGPQYAQYLRGVVAAFALPVLTDTDVFGVTASEAGFAVDTSHGPVHARNLIWAGGEFVDRQIPRCKGSNFAVHSSAESAWADNDRHSSEHDDHVIVLGGYESGIDIACHHVARGTTVTVVDGDAPWQAGPSSDASTRLAPRTRMRLSTAKATGRLTLIDSSASSIGVAQGRYTVRLTSGATLSSTRAPIAATGFGSGLGPVSAMFAQRRDGWPELDSNDESTLTPGLFLSGPAVRHGSMKFCFIYKFRQRFAHIAGVIADRLGHDAAALDEWRAAGMLTDDLSCCGVECAC